MKYTDKNIRPLPVVPQFENIPAELQALKQWVMWKYIWKSDESDKTKGVWSKIPFSTNNSSASSTDKNTWSSFRTAMMTYNQRQNDFDGIGFVFDPKGEYIGIDLDDCLRMKPDGYELKPFALNIFQQLQTYTEVSPSKTGLHLIGKVSDFKLIRKRFQYEGNEIEVYKEGRYFTFTGAAPPPPLPIIDVKKVLTEILDIVTPKAEEKKKVEAEDKKNQDVPLLSLSINSRLRMALKNERTRRLFEGDTSDHGGDDSRADMALCRSLAYFCEGDRDILDAMFRQSKLFRGKWDEKRGHDTYGNITMDGILATQEKYADFINLKKKQASTFDTRKSRRLTVNDMWDLTMEYRRSGEAKGVECDWENLNELYRPAKGQSTIITGLPGSGKSTFLDVYAFQLAKMHDWKFTFASFETLPLQRHILNFAQIATGKQTFEFIYDSATDDEMEEVREFLNDHFFFLNPADEDFTMDGILSYVADDIKEYNIDGFVLDTFTELEDGMLPGETETKMIKRILKRQMRFAQQNNIHSWTVAHPAKSQENFVDDGYSGKRPTLSSIGGSQNFYNKIDFGIIVHRPKKERDKTVVYVDKVRFDVNGQPGEANFVYDKTMRCYTPIRKNAETDEKEWSY